MAVPRLGDRTLFTDLAARVYFNHAAVSPPSLAVREAIDRALDAYAQLGAAAWTQFRDQRERLRGKLARLVNANAADLALVASTTQGVLDIALCMPWRAGDRLVSFQGEFPANVTPWQRAAAEHQLEFVLLPVSDHAADADQALVSLERELKRGVRLIAVSAVQFQTGLRMPLAHITTLGHRYGAQVFVDGIQAVGGVPIDVHALDLDYLVAGSHKWLMAPEGCGFLYVKAECARQLRSVVAGWLSHEDAAGFLFEGAGHLRYDRAIRKRADFLEIGAMNTLGYVGLEAALDLLLELSVASIFAHVQTILDPLEEGLRERGFRSLRALDAARRSCILGVLTPASESLIPCWRRLNEQGIACSMPDGVLRFSPHWPNDVDQVAAVLDVIDGR